MDTSSKYTAPSGTWPLTYDLLGSMSATTLRSVLLLFLWLLAEILPFFLAENIKLSSSRLSRSEPPPLPQAPPLGLSRLTVFIAVLKLTELFRNIP